MYDIRMDIN
jgi:serine/threonine protein kinase